MENKARANANRVMNRFINEGEQRIKKGEDKNLVLAEVYRKALQIISEGKLDSPGQLAHNALYIESVQPDSESVIKTQRFFEDQFK